MGSTSDKKVNELLKLENGIYNDIVQENFIDAYRNLTYKGIMAMKWISEYCTNAKYILKVDDDIISNIFIVLRHLNHLTKNQLIPPKTIMCLVWQQMKVMREKQSKWYVSKEEFFDDMYGPYCSGSAYIFTSDLPSLMYNTSLFIKFFWVDDYFMTGLLGRSVGASFKQLNSIYIINHKLVDQRFKSKQSDYTAFGHLPNQLNNLYILWNFLLKRQLFMHPNLNSSIATLIKENDFSYLPDLTWPLKF
jgi:beta-1,3-galactosyltransferase 1